MMATFPKLESLLDMLTQVEQMLVEVQPQVTDPELKEHVGNVLVDFRNQRSELVEHYPKAVQYLEREREQLEKAVADLQRDAAAWEAEIAALKAERAKAATRAAAPVPPSSAARPAAPAPSPAIALSDGSVWKDSDEVPWEQSSVTETPPAVARPNPPAKPAAAWDPGASVRDFDDGPAATSDSDSSVSASSLDDDSPKKKAKGKNTRKKK